MKQCLFSGGHTTLFKSKLSKVLFINECQMKKNMQDPASIYPPPPSALCIKRRMAPLTPIQFLKTFKKLDQLLSIIIFPVYMCENVQYIYSLDLKDSFFKIMLQYFLMMNGFVDRERCLISLSDVTKCRFRHQTLKSKVRQVS